MDHSEAIKLRASERYLLGELSVEQRDQFEEHFFDCTECAADVRSGAILVDNAREIIGQESFQTDEAHVAEKRVRVPGWFGWLQPAWGFAAAAVLILAGVLAYQNLVTIPALKNSAAQPQTLLSFSLVTAGSRGAGTAVIQAPKDQPFGLYLDIPAGATFSYYTVGIQTETGSRPVQVRVTPEQARDTVQILVPARTLQPGNVSVVVEGHERSSGSVTEVVRYPLVIQY